MSEYMFGVSRSKLSRRDAARMARIAKRHGAYLVEATIPGTGYQRWFAGPNLGFPHDAAMASAVFADLRAVGLMEDK